MADRSRRKEGFMSRILKFLTFIAASLMAQMAIAQVSYQYTGTPFKLFCGPTPVCIADPSGTSYAVGDFVTATLTLDQPLASNLTSQDVTGLPGFALTMNDKHQTLTSGSPGYFVLATVSTDGNGQIIAPWEVLVAHSGYPYNTIITITHAPVQIFDEGILTEPDSLHPSTPYNNGITDEPGIPGVWSPTGGGGGTPTYGTVSRVIINDQYPGDAGDVTSGDVGAVQTPLVWYSTVGVQAAYPKITGTLSSGAWSDTASAQGTGRGLAFRNFINNNSGPVTVKVNALLNGQFQVAPFGLPTGPLNAGAAIHVFDAAKFASTLSAQKTNGVTAATYMLGGISIMSSLQFADLHTLFPGALLAYGSVLEANGPFGSSSTPVSTSGFTAQAGQVFTVVFDVATSSFPIGLADGTIGGGDVYFLDTLQPAANLFTDAVTGAPITGIGTVDSPPSLPPAPATLSLTPGTATNPVGTKHTVTATALTAGAAPVPNTVVKFSITSGPNTGTSGAGTTNASGVTTFTYADNNGAGIDTIQANIGSLQSNPADKTWSGPAKCV